MPALRESEGSGDSTLWRPVPLNRADVTLTTDSARPVRRRSDEEHMSEANKALAKKWFEEVWNKRRREAIDEMLSPHAVIYEGSQIAKGPEGFRPFFDRMWEAFSDIKITVHETLAAGDRECVRWACIARHTGEG